MTLGVLALTFTAIGMWYRPHVELWNRLEVMRIAGEQGQSMGDGARRSRERYERQGILAEPAAIERAEQECFSDAEVRVRRRERDGIRRADEDVRFAADFAAAIAAQFPNCPTRRAEAIARHAATRGSGRVGRSAAGRALDPNAVRLAVAASVRHVDTSYDELLMSGVDREEARRRVGELVEDVLSGWRVTSR